MFENKLRAGQASLLIVVICVGVAVLGLLVPYSVYADKATSQCASSGYPVCVEQNIYIQNGFGRLKSIYRASFQLFSVFPNGTIFFDVTGLAPQLDVVLQFEAQSYGNGTFDIRIRGPPAIAIHSEATNIQTSSRGTWGAGVEVIYTTITAPHTLIVNYVGIGPGCFPVCPSQHFWTLYTYAVVLIPAALSVVAIVLRFRKQFRLQLRRAIFSLKRRFAGLS